jgi:hypothetical protein
VIHTYRDAAVYGSKHSSQSWLGFGLMVVLLFGLFVFTGSQFTWTEVGMIGGFIGFALATTYRAHRREQYGSCGEIRLDDDGTCELETKRRVIRLDVSEIRSVKYWRDSESKSENYAIYYRGGNLRVTERMTDWLDFLTRLATLNPAVDLTSFPAVLADALPNKGGQATEERVARMSRFVRNALFPLIIISALVWLAIQTMSSN